MEGERREGEEEEEGTRKGWKAVEGTKRTRGGLRWTELGAPDGQVSAV